jgi:hypothetical protein
MAELKRDDLALTDDDLLQEFHSVASKFGRIPTWALFAHNSQISADVVHRRFGGLQDTLKQYPPGSKPITLNRHCFRLRPSVPDSPDRPAPSGVMDECR